MAVLEERETKQSDRVYQSECGSTMLVAKDCWDILVGRTACTRAGDLSSRQG
jgi:hypothetical protein